MSDSETPRTDPGPEPAQRGPERGDAARPPIPPPLQAPAGSASSGFVQAFAPSAGRPRRRSRAPRPGSGPDAAARPARRRLVWAALALLVLAGGSIGSYFGARSVARSDRAARARSFSADAATISTSVAVAIQHEEDLGIAGSTFFAGDPSATPGQFAAWVRWTETLRRYPEITSLGLVRIITASELPAFLAGPARPAAAGAAAPTAAQIAAASRRVAPAGARPYYCLASAELVRDAADRPRSGADYCAAGYRLLISRDSGIASYTHVRVDGAKALEIDIPVYTPGAPTSTSAERIAGFVGWLRETLVPAGVLAQASAGRGVDAVRLRYRTPAAHVVYTSGTPDRGGQTRQIAIQSGWTVKTYGPALASGLGADSDAKLYLAAGILLSLLSALMLLMMGSEPRPLQASPADRGGPGDLHDPLTGQPGRVLMLDRAAGIIARAGRESGKVAGALFVELDCLKDIRGKLGEESATQLRRIAAERLQAVVRAQDTVGGLGGDEFVILVEAAARGVRLDSLARRIIESLRKPVELEGFAPTFVVTASVGVAFGGYSTPEQMLGDARRAMEASRVAGGDRYTLFNGNMRSVTSGGGVLEVDLAGALGEDQLFLLYEPVVEVASGRIVALDATVRWRHPVQGELPPEHFMALAEETGLIIPIGRWAMEEACAHAAALGVAGHRVPVCVSISPAQFGRERLATDVGRALQQSGLDPSLLMLELPEASVMRDVQESAQRLQALKELGVKIAIDDFGSGYAYHADLQRLPVDHLRVDPAALGSSDDEDYRAWLFEAILLTGRELSLTVVAKGIDTDERLEALRATACTLAQGTVLCDQVVAQALPGLFGTPTAQEPVPGDGADAGEVRASGPTDAAAAASEQ